MMLAGLINGNQQNLVMPSESPAPAEACAPVIPLLPPTENLTFSVYYQWGLIWIGAGELNLSLNQSTLPGQPNGAVYAHAVAQTRSSSRIDRIYKVNDRYETWFDPITMLPAHFQRDVQEGNTRFYWEYTFNRHADNIDYLHRTKRGQTEGQLQQVQGCVGDLFSTLYFLRSVDWSQYRPGQQAPMTMVIDGKIQQLSVKLVRRERIKTKLGYTDCLVLEPQLMVGEYFKDDEGLTLWLSDDQRRLPIRCETKILVGALKADLLP